MDAEEKDKVLDGGVAEWMWVDGKIAGEAYGKVVAELDEEIEDCEKYASAFYIYSFTILPEFQKAGLGKVLFAYFLGRIYADYERIVMHATSPGMVRLGETFGFQKGTVRQKWYDTEREAVFMYR